MKGHCAPDQLGYAKQAVGSKTCHPRCERQRREKYQIYKTQMYFEVQDILLTLKTTKFLVHLKRVNAL